MNKDMKMSHSSFKLKTESSYCFFVRRNTSGSCQGLSEKEKEGLSVPFSQISHHTMCFPLITFQLQKPEEIKDPDSAAAVDLRLHHEGDLTYDSRLLLSL